MNGLHPGRLARLQRVLDGYVERGEVDGLVWAVARRGATHVGVAGTAVRDSIFRISSMTKPITAVAAMILVEECVIRLDDPVDELLPELADRRVMVRPDGALDDTVPADRPITLRDVLTFRLGHGMDFGASGPQPLLAALGELGLESGPPAPSAAPAPDEWMRRLGTLPLEHQPGEQWRYHTGADVLGVLLSRAAGAPFGDVLRDRIFEPLGMTDTGFAVSATDRLGPCIFTDPATGERTVYDPPNGQWSTPPAFPGGGAGLVSTVDDYLRFASMLLAGGQGVLARPTIELMTANHLTAEQLAASGPDPSGAQGWGFGVGVQLRRTGFQSIGSYGWAGGLGSVWANDPAAGLAGVLLTTQMMSSPSLPPVFQDFWTGAYAAIDD